MDATCARHDHVEFEKCAARTKKQAFNIAYRLTGNSDDAEDLVQEAYLRAFRGFDKYDRELPFENWFFRILGNLHTDSLRRKGNLNPLSLDQLLADENGEWALEIPDSRGNPADLICAEYLDQSLERALGKLPRVFRISVILFDLEDRSYQDIANAMNCSIGTVRSRIHRGRNMLRHYFGAVQTPRQLTETASRN